jgi:hypothetical protein
LGSPIAGIGFAAAGLLNKAFTANGSKDRNVAAYSQATGAKSVTLPMGHMGVSYWNVGGKLVDTKTFNDLAGSWYGATFAPDGNQSDWEQKYQTALQNVPEVTLPKGWVWNGTNLVRG